MNTQTADPNAKKILVVDDNRVILRVLTVALQPKGYKVLTALSGPETLSTVRKEKPDLILLDLSFPPDAVNVGGALQDGFFIIEWLRRTPEAEKIPIIIISSSDPAQYQKRATAAKVAACFRKPIDNNKLLETIHAILSEEMTGRPPELPANFEV